MMILGVNKYRRSYTTVEWGIQGYITVPLIWIFSCIYYLDMVFLFVLFLAIFLFMLQNKRLKRAALICTKLFLENIVVKDKDEGQKNLGEGFDLE